MGSFWKLAVGRGLAQDRWFPFLSLFCSASLIQAWAISSKRVLFVGSLVACARRRHSAAFC
jgi:hypothetical protein